MPFINPHGLKISFECEELIEELSADIREFGESLEVEVVTSQCCGITVYKDYNFLSEDDPENDFQLDDGETLVKILAVELLEIYKEQDAVI